jgi:hypothetical protein
MDINESKSPPSDNAIQALALEDYDLVILSDGTGATLAAWTFASQGQRLETSEQGLRFMTRFLTAQTNSPRRRKQSSL